MPLPQAGPAAAAAACRLAGKPGPANGLAGSKSLAGNAGPGLSARSLVLVVSGWTRVGTLVRSGPCPRAVMFVANKTFFIRIRSPKILLQGGLSTLAALCSS